MSFSRRAGGRKGWGGVLGVLLRGGGRGVHRLSPFLLSERKVVKSVLSACFLGGEKGWGAYFRFQPRDREFDGGWLWGEEVRRSHFSWRGEGGKVWVSSFTCSRRGRKRGWREGAERLVRGSLGDEEEKGEGWWDGRFSLC